MTAVALSTALAVLGSIPANATPTYVPKSFQSHTGSSDLLRVRDGVRWRKGYRGYRYHRPGYRYDNGWWFPAGAFVAGAIIGGAIADSYDGGTYYRDRYYGGYYPQEYYPRRVYVAPSDRAYRQGYRDGYRAGRSDRYYGGICSPRLQDAGKC